MNKQNPKQAAGRTAGLTSLSHRTTINYILIGNMYNILNYCYMAEHIMLN